MFLWDYVNRFFRPYAIISTLKKCKEIKGFNAFSTSKNKLHTISST